jgi:DNA-directed RNA polymerase sigma subunit (sigma70/sigma32)
MKLAKDNMKDANIKKCFQYVIERFDFVKSYEDLKVLISLISETSRKVFEARWGLDGGKYCHMFKTLDKKLGIHHSKRLYEQALFEMKNVEYKVKYAKFFHFYNVKMNDSDAGYIYLLYDITHGSLRNFSNLSFREIKSICINAMSALTDKQRFVLINLYGLFGCQVCSIQTLSEMMNDSIDTIQHLETFGFKRLFVRMKFIIEVLPNKN